MSTSSYYMRIVVTPCSVEVYYPEDSEALETLPIIALRYNGTNHYSPLAFRVKGINPCHASLKTRKGLVTLAVPLFDVFVCRHPFPSRARQWCWRRLRFPFHCEVCVVTLFRCPLVILGF